MAGVVAPMQAAIELRTSKIDQFASHQASSDAKISKLSADVADIRSRLEAVEVSSGAVGSSSTTGRGRRGLFMS